MSFGVTTLLYSRPVSYEALPRVLDSALAHGADELRVKILVSDTPLPSLHERATDGTRQFVEHYRTHDAWSGFISEHFGRKRGYDVSGNFASVRHPEHPNVSIVVTDASTEFLKKTFRRFIRGLHGHIVAPILRTGQIANLFAQLQARSHVSSLRVTQLGSRSRIRSQGATKGVELDRKWTDLSLDEAFSEALQSGQWVTDAQIDYSVEGSRTASAKINRYGVFVFKKLIGPAFDAMIEPATRMAQRWFAFLGNRARAKTTSYRSRPFGIDFQHPALESPEQVSLLRRALLKMPRVTCSVVHGNPYFHAVMVDYHDGSTYEVVVLSDNVMTVIPQGRATVRSLQRLCSQVFAEFREGDLTELADVG